MKKTYEKPKIRLEMLSISTPVASSCEGIANFAIGLCSVTIDVGFEMEIFQSANICEYHGPGVDDMVCYHAPSDNNNIFTS